jgi:hypothetical protein
VIPNGDEDASSSFVGVANSLMQPKKGRSADRETSQEFRARDTEETARSDGATTTSGQD